MKDQKTKKGCGYQYIYTYSSEDTIVLMDEYGNRFMGKRGPAIVNGQRSKMWPPKDWPEDSDKYFNPK